MPLPPVTPADLLRINDCISQNPQNPGSKSKKIENKSSFNPEQQPDPTNTAIAQFTIIYGLRASVQHTDCLTVAGMYKNYTKEESPEIGI